jgi:hypothetical protein
MYPMNSNGVGAANRLPRESRAAAAESSSPTLGKAIGGAVLQAAAIVIVAKVVDMAVEAFVNRRRERQQAPQRGRREEPVGA